MNDKYSVLIIEDEPELLELLIEQVSDHCESKLPTVIDSTPSIKEGIKMAGSGGYNLIILDLHLKDGHGNELINQSESLCNNSTIIVLSADITSCTLEDNDRIFFLEKPFPEKQLNFYLNMALKNELLQKQA